MVYVYCCYIIVLCIVYCVCGYLLCFVQKILSLGCRVYLWYVHMVNIFNSNSIFVLSTSICIKLYIRNTYRSCLYYFYLWIIYLLFYFIRLSYAKNTKQK